MKALLSEAMTAFGLTSAKFIQQHENAVYRADEKYLLRIHKAAKGLQADHDPDKRRAELALLTHLADHGLPVQRPLAETTLSDGTQATLLTWLEKPSSPLTCNGKLARWLPNSIRLPQDSIMTPCAGMTPPISPIWRTHCWAWDSVIN